MQRGVDVYDGQMPYVNVDPLLDPFRSDPRLQDLVRRMNFAP